MDLRATAVAFIVLFNPFSPRAQAIRHLPVAFRSVPELSLVTDESIRDKIGSYRMGRSLTGKFLTLDSSQHFQGGEYSCIGHSFGDSGTWKADHKGRIGLRLAGRSRVYEFVRFSHYYFCIPSANGRAFVRDLVKARKKNSRIKPVTIDGRVFNAADAIAFALMYHYYGRDAEAIPLSSSRPLPCIHVCTTPLFDFAPHLCTVDHR